MQYARFANWWGLPVCHTAIVSFFVFFVLVVNAQAQTVLIYPKSSTVELSTRVPFSCTVDGKAGGCTWTLVTGPGTLSTTGIYTAPATGTGSAVIRAASGTSTADAIVTLGGSLPSYNCGSYPARGANFNTCTMQHAELVGGTDTRYYGVIIPVNYVPGKSGLILKINGTTHGIAGDCKLTQAGSELAGWIPYVLGVPSPAPVIVCPQMLYNTGEANNGERPNAWGFHDWIWAGGFVPNDVDFLRQIVLATVKDLNLDPKKVFVTNDWYPHTSILGEQFASQNSDLVAAVGLYNDGLFANITSDFLDTDGAKIPSPKGPVSVIMLASTLSAWKQSMCGTNTPWPTLHPLTVDDIFSYWQATDKPTTLTYEDPSGSNKKFCSGTYGSKGFGLATTLENLNASGGLANTEIQVWKMVGNAEGTPFCSFDSYGNDTFCNSGSGPAIDLRPTSTYPPGVCTWTHPCNHYVNTTTGYDILGLIYKFFLAHPKA